MIKIIIAAFAAAAAAGSPPSGAADRFVSEFAATCAIANGDFEAMKRALKSAGFREKSYLKAYPLSLYATRESRTLVYRGVSDKGAGLNTPQCMLQTGRIPGGDFDRLGAMIQSRLGLPKAEKTTNSAGRPLLKWIVEGGTRPMQISLVDDRLLGEPNLRLTIMPRYGPDLPRKVPPRIIEVERE